MTEYSGSLDCSTGITNTVIIQTGFTENTCISGSFSSNEYFPTFSGDSVRINCNANVEWFAEDDGRYQLSRQTSTLEAASALDYTRDNCLENSIVTEMNYCLLNRVGTSCYPTNSDANNDIFCLNALTTYAYTGSCLNDQYNSRFLQYKSDNSGAGYLNMYCYGEFDEETSLVLPYSDCLGCNRFKDLPNENNSGILVGIIVAIVIGVLICCAVCFGGAFVLMYGFAALVALICCRKKKNNEEFQKSEPVTAPIHIVNATEISGPPMIELLHVQVPVGASAGSVIMVTKSTGQQVQVVIPEGVSPGQIIEVKA